MPNCRPSACTRRLSDSTPLGKAAGSAARLPSASRSGACLRASVTGASARREHIHAPAVVQRHQGVACKRGATLLSAAVQTAATQFARSHAPTCLSPSATNACAASSIVCSVTLQLRKRAVRGCVTATATATPLQHHAPEIVPRVEAHRRRQAKTIVQAATAADERQRERSTERDM